MKDEPMVKVKRTDHISEVIASSNYANHVRGKAVCIVENTGNGYIVRFPAFSCVEQDYFVCLDYAQAYDLIHGLSAFKAELGFSENQ
jgi:hypothetical protein